MEKRIIPLNINTQSTGDCVVYVMSRDQRIHDNHALLAAQSAAFTQKLPLIIVFHLLPSVKNRLKEQYDFMISGLQEVHKEAALYNIPLLVTTTSLPETLASLHPSEVYFDMSPLRGARKNHAFIASTNTFRCYEVDTHNIVPVRVASDKEEFAAYTIRPKITKLLPEFLVEPDKLQKHPYSVKKTLTEPDWEEISSQVKAPSYPGYTITFEPGEHAALAKLHSFIEFKLLRYDTLRNEPSIDGTSDLSPYLHFGMISSLRIALEIEKYVKKHPEHQTQADAYLEELIIRKELADNYCYYNKNYDSLDGLKEWALKTIKKHWDDPREFVYTYTELEQAKTHDPAWNSAQRQLIKTGKIHGCMRMYWAKKVLEWTNHPDTALEYLIRLNDTFHIDGHDPNGYVGILWSIGGLHDRAWIERPIFGQIRYMNFNGLKRKLDIDSYINAWS